MGKKNKSLAAGVVWKPVTIQQAEGEPVDIYVRGLSLTDLSTVMAEDGGEQLGELYRRLVTVSTTPADIEAVGTDIIQAVPELIAKLIARAADLYEEWPEVTRLSIGAQIDAVREVASLTFASESVRKKAMEMVLRFGKADESPLTDTILKAMPNGGGDSEAKPAS